MTEHESHCRTTSPSWSEFPVLKVVTVNPLGQCWSKKHKDSALCHVERSSRCYDEPGRCNLFHMTSCCFRWDSSSWDLLPTDSSGTTFCKERICWDKNSQWVSRWFLDWLWSWQENLISKTVLICFEWSAMIMLGYRLIPSCCSFFSVPCLGCDGHTNPCHAFQVCHTVLFQALSLAK